MTMGLLLLGGNAYSEPSKQIDVLMHTPASAFDLFLFQLFERTKCQTWFGSKDQADICMTTINYDFDDNLIEMNFRALETYEHLKGFKAAPEKQKIELMKSSLTQLASSVGLTKASAGFRYGMIQSIPIRHGWSTKSLNMKEVKEEIVKRTVLFLHFTYSGKTYKAKRDHHGKVSVEAKKSL